MTPLSRRESEVLDCVYKLGQPTAKEVQAALDDGASYSTVRTLLRNIMEKGWLTRKEQGFRYIYLPTVKPQKAANQAIRKLVSTFFDNSTASAVSSLLKMENESFSREEIDQLERLLELKRKESKDSVE